MHVLFDLARPAPPLFVADLLLLMRLDISLGSVATHLRCRVIFSYSIITNFLLILTVK